MIIPTLTTLRADATYYTVYRSYDERLGSLLHQDPLDPCELDVCHLIRPLFFLINSKEVSLDLHNYSIPIDSESDTARRLHASFKS